MIRAREHHEQQRRRSHLLQKLHRADQQQPTHVVKTHDLGACLMQLYKSKYNGQLVFKQGTYDRAYNTVEGLHSCLVQLLRRGVLIGHGPPCGKSLNHFTMKKLLDEAHLGATKAWAPAAQAIAITADFILS